MKIKYLLLTLACVTIIPGAYAQSAEEKIMIEGFKRACKPQQIAPGMFTTVKAKDVIDYINGAIFEAADKGFLTALNMMIIAGADVNGTNYAGDTPLLKAAKGGYTACVQALIKAGADVNYIDPLRITALLLAASRHHTGCVKALISAGAQPNLGKSVDPATRALITRCEKELQEEVQTEEEQAEKPQPYPGLAVIKPNANMSCKNDKRSFKAGDWVIVKRSSFEMPYTYGKVMSHAGKIYIEVEAGPKLWENYPEIYRVPAE